MKKIPGGYYIKARKAHRSEIASAPPHVREIWDYLMGNANHKEGISSGRKINRGQLVRTYSQIIESLVWYVGYRKCAYKKHHCEIAMKWLVKRRMIATLKTTRGLLITIINFDYYQNPKNYENDSGNDNKTTTERQCNDTINKNEKNDKKNNKYTSDSDEIRLSKYLFNHILKNNPKAKGPNYQSWAAHIEKTIRIDNRTIEDIKSVIQWCQNDEFWKSNILSTSKLRKQFDALYLKMNQEQNASVCGPTPKTYAQHQDAEQREMTKAALKYQRMKDGLISGDSESGAGGNQQLLPATKVN